MRGFVMVLMVVDHASMAYNAQHNSSDSAALYMSGTPLPALEFFIRWISHLCAPVFVFLAGTALAAFVVVRYFNDYGNVFLYRADDSWLHVSKYPPSASFTFLELGLMSIILALMMQAERWIGMRPNGVLLVFGQTAMIFYLVHQLVLEGSATFGGLRHFGDLNTVYGVSAVMLVLLYPFCLWYRGLKSRHRDSIWLKYF